MRLCPEQVWAGSCIVSLARTAGTELTWCQLQKDSVSSGTVCECGVSLPEIQVDGWWMSRVGWISTLCHLAVVLLVQDKEGGGWIHPSLAWSSSMGLCGSLVSVWHLLPR